MLIPPGYRVFPVIRGTWLSRSPNAWAGFSVALWGLCVVLLSAASWGDWFGLQGWMTATPNLVFQQGEWHRLWSTLFVHSDPKHLLSNLFLLFILGYFLAAYFGAWRIPLIAVAMGGLTNFWVLSNMPPQTALVGISGVVFWLGGAWLTLYVLLDRSRSLAQRWIRGIGVGLMLFLPAEAFDPSISYQSHAVGFFLGSLWGVAFFVWKKRELRSAELYELRLEETDQTLPDSALHIPINFDVRSVSPGSHQSPP